MFTSSAIAQYLFITADSYPEENTALVNQARNLLALLKPRTLPRDIMLEACRRWAANYGSEYTDLAESIMYHILALYIANQAKTVLQTQNQASAEGHTAVLPVMLAVFYSRGWAEEQNALDVIGYFLCTRWGATWGTAEDSLRVANCLTQIYK